MMIRIPVRRFFAVLLAGFLLFGIQVLFQHELAVSFGTGESLLVLVILTGLLGSALGALLPPFPAFLSPLFLGLLLLLPPGTTPDTLAIYFLLSLGAGKWVVDLLRSVNPEYRSSILMLEWVGGSVVLALLVVVLLQKLPMHQLRWLFTGMAMLGAILTGNLSYAPPPHDTASKFTGTVKPHLLALWSGAQFFFSQTTWSHFVAQSHSNSITAYGTVLLAMVASMPLSAWLSRKIQSPFWIIFAALLGLLWIPLAHMFWGSSLPTYFAQDSYPWRILAMDLVLLGPASVGVSMLFPFLLQRTPALSSLYAVNLAGGILGVLAAGFLALPRIGQQGSFIILCVCWAFLGIVLAPRRFRVPYGLSMIALGAACPVLWNIATAQMVGDYTVIEQRDGWDGRMEVVQKGANLFILSNGNYALGGTRALAEERIQARLALELRPKARSIFVLGLGTGITAAELITSHSLDTIQIAELSKNVIRLSQTHFQPWLNRLFQDPRTTVLHADARVALRDSRNQYDLILGDLFLPWLPGAELLMTEEHFGTVQDHLSKNGVFVQWLPLYQLSETMVQDALATMLRVFPEVFVFHDASGFREPAIALVAPKAGSQLWAEGSFPTVLETYIGNARNWKSDLAGATPWTTDNRIQRLLTTGGIYPGMPKPGTSLTGERFLNWIATRFRSHPPEKEPSLNEFGSDAWRYAAKGFFLQQASFYAQRQDWQNAGLMQDRALVYGPKASPITAPSPKPTR